MSLCKSIFRKGLYELSIEDLEAFFSIDQEETSVLEFKTGGVSLEGIHKEVAAFLNTEGGILVIGAPQEKKHPEKKHLKICSGALTPSTLVRDQDTLIRSIASNISPNPSTIKVNALAKGPGTVYVLEIGQSITPPHQVDGTYYIRLERDSKPAPHGLVEALFFKRQKSDLRVDSLILVKPNNRQVRFTLEFRNDSLIHIDKFGWSIRFLGVRMCTEMQPEKMMSAISDDSTTGRLELNSMLVKGMLLKTEFELHLRYPFFYFELMYYSPDQKLETIRALYHTELNKCLFLANSKHPEANVGNDEIIKDQYEQLLHRSIHVFLKAGSWYNELAEPAMPEEISELEYEFDVQLPDSLLVFWKLTNGFSGSIGMSSFIIYPVQYFRKHNKLQKNTGNNKRLEIGQINDRPIHLQYRERQPYFEWWSAEGYQKKNNFSSFFDIIEDLIPQIGTHD